MGQIRRAPERGSPERPVTSLADGSNPSRPAPNKAGLSHRRALMHDEKPFTLWWDESSGIVSIVAKDGSVIAEMTISQWSRMIANPVRRIVKKVS